MSDTADTANVIIRPPIAWALTVLAALTLQWLIAAMSKSPEKVIFRRWRMALLSHVPYHRCSPNH